ncbi:hypothetical protein AAUPMC_08487, partial [Pasteurella multocida subsp. multocida str. Anand1_cattle]
AIGAYLNANGEGSRCQNKLPLQVFTDMMWGQSMTPQLATVITPRLEIGKIATQELLNRIHGMPQQSAIINLGYQIHLGESI